MSGDLGEAVLYLKTDNTKLLAGLNEAQAAAQRAGNAMAGAFGAAGTAAGNAFSTSAANGVKTGSTGIQSGFQGVLSGLSSGAGSAGQSAGASMASRMAAGIKAGSGSILAAGQSLGSSMRSYWGGIGVQLGYSINAGIARGIGAGIGALLDTKNIAAFDAASRKVAQLTDDTKGMQVAAHNLAKELKYSTTSTELLKAGYETLSSGISGTANVMGVLRAATKATVASQGEAKLDKVNDAITSIINSYKQWGMSAKDADSIINQISGTVDAGKIKYGEYSQQIGKAASIAASAGVSFLELNTAIAKATISGQLPESVLSGIPGLITNIQKPTKAAVQTAAELGIQFDAAALKSKGLLGIMESIANAKTRDGRSGKDGEVITRLFGSIRGRNVATALIQDTAGSRDTREQIKKGNVDKNFDLATGGISARKEAFTNRLIELDIKIKEGAIGKAIAAGFEIAGRIVGVFASALEGINQAYQTLSPAQQAFVNGLTGIATVVLAGAAGLAVIGTAIGLFGAGLATASGILGGFLVGFGQIALAVAPVAVPITALSAAVYGLAKAFGATDTQAFTAALVAAGAGLAVVFGPAAIAAIGTAASALVAGFVSIGTAAAAALIPLLPWIAAAAGVAAALYLLKLAYDANKEAINKWLAGVVTAITPAMESVKSFGIAALAFAKSWFDSWMGVWRVVIQVAQGIASALAPVVKFVVDTFPAAWNLARAIIGKAIDGLAVDAKIKFAIISTVIQAAIKVIEFFVNWVKFSANTAISLFGAMRDAASNSFASMGRLIEDARGKFPGFDNAVKTSGNGFEAFRLTIQTQADLAGKAIQYFIDAANLGVNVLMRELDKVGQFFNNLPALINNAAKSISNFGKPSAPVPATPSTAPATYGPIKPTAYGGGGMLFASAALGQIVSDGAGLLAQRRSFDSAPIGSASGTRISSPIANQTLEQAKRNTTQYGAGRRGGRVHNKTDFVGSPGTPVLAIMDGVATLEGPSKWYGGVSEASVRFQSDDEKTTARYYHLDRKTRELFGNQRSMRVRAGQKVGYVGADGNVPNSVGPHLDLDLRVNGKPVTFGQFAQLVDGTASESGSTAATAAQQLALRQAKEDLDVAEKKLAEVRAEGPRGKNTAASRSAYQRRIKAAEEHIRKKKQALERAELRVSSTGGIDEQRSAAIGGVSTTFQAIQSRFSLANKTIENSGASQLSQDIAKAENLQQQESEIKALIPQIQALRKLYGGTKEGQIAVDGLENTVQEAIAANRAAQQTVNAGQREIEVSTTQSIVSRADAIIANAEKKKQEIDNAIKGGYPGAPSQNQGEIQKARIDSALVEQLNGTVAALRRYKETIPNDTEGMKLVDEQIARIKKLQADKIAELRSGRTSLITNEITAIQGRRGDQVNEVKYRQAVGDITEAEATSRIALALKTENEELNKLLPLLDDYRKAWAGDTQAEEQINGIARQLLVLETDYRNFEKTALAAREAADLAKLKKVSDAANVQAAEEEALIAQDLATGAMDEAEAAKESLAVKLRAAEALREQLGLTIALRDTLTDRGAIEAANEHIAALQQVINNAEAAEYAYKKTAYEASVLGQTTKLMTESINTGLQDLAKSALHGFKDFSSILDGIINKIADIAINALVGGIGGGGKGGTGLLGLVGSIFGFAKGSQSVPNYASGTDGISKALTRERMISGKRPYLAALHDGEAVLSTLTGDAQLYQAMQRDGRWNEIKRVENFARGTPVVSRSTAGASSRSGNATVTVDRINSVDYVSVEQLNQILTIELPLAAQGGADIVNQQMRNPGQRTRWGI
jgi:TP901 family phage tail tape measure protein